MNTLLLSLALAAPPQAPPAVAWSADPADRLARLEAASGAQDSRIRALEDAVFGRPGGGVTTAAAKAVQGVTPGVFTRFRDAAGNYWNVTTAGKVEWCDECNGRPAAPNTAAAGSVSLTTTACPPAAAAAYYPQATYAAPGVAAYPFRRGVGYNPSHRCPNCGRSQYVVSGRGPAPGTHTHMCGGCGTAWYH